MRETSPVLGVFRILDGPFPSDREEEVRWGLSGSRRGKMRQGSACRCLHWPEPVSTWPGPKLMEGCIVLSDHLEIQSPPKDCSSWVSKKGQKEIPEDDTRGCFLWESHQQGSGDVELVEGQDAGLGAYRLVTLGKSVKDVAATSQAAVLEGTSQCSQKLVTSGSHGGLGEHRPVGPPDVWRWSEERPKLCA